MPDPAFRLQLADSELARLDAEPAAGRLTLRLAAAQVDRLDGDTAVAGFLPAVTLVFDGVRPEAAPPAVAGRIAAARLHDGQRWCTTLPLPGRLDGTLRLEATLPHGATLAVHAQALTMQLDDARRFRESFAC